MGEQRPLMCGICGIWQHMGHGAIAPMIAAMEHRGPDDYGEWQDDTVRLGMSRLAVLDLTAAGHQPMTSSDGNVCLVFNGEVYNYREERTLLEQKGHRFSSSSDTEVVLRLYEQYGDEFVSRLRGMFALAIYDRRGGYGRERLVLARDHFGIKPLLYARVGRTLVFASELKALLASGLVPSAIDPDSFRQLLTYGSVQQPQTILQGVHMLPAAHLLLADQSGVKVHRYWRLETGRHPELASAPYADQVEAVRAALEQSVRMQMVSDVPLGAFLSGGIDSALMVALMTQQSGQRLRTYSVGFDEEGRDIDEGSAARAMAAHLGADHESIIVRGPDVADRIEAIAAALDQPSVDGVNSYFVSLAARRGVTVSISGTGGDELFAGYPWFAEVIRLSSRFEAQGRWSSGLRRHAGDVARSAAAERLMSGPLGPKLLRLRTYGSVLNWYSSRTAIFTTDHVARMLATDTREIARAGRSAHRDLGRYDELSGGGLLPRVSALTIRSYLVNQLLRDVDVMSMAHSLEVRVPFIDPAVADIALSLPDSSKLGDVAMTGYSQSNTYAQSGAKRILFDVGRHLLPPGVDIQPKRGFAMPFASWLNGPLRDVLGDTLSPDAVRRRGLFDWRETERARKAFAESHTHWSQVWLLMMVELWFRNVLDPGATWRQAATAPRIPPAKSVSDS